MPYRSKRKRREAVRRWYLKHKADKAAYMRTYRKRKSTGRGPGRPRKIASTDA